MAVVTIDSYSESNYSSYFPLTLAGHGYTPAVGQSFTGNGGTLNSVELYLSKDSAITGSVYCYIYTHTGTYGTSSAPTTPLLATSDVLNVTSIPNEPTLGLVSFTFSGDEQITLEDGVYYEIYFSVVGISNDGPSAYISVGGDDSSSTHSGNAYYNHTVYSGADLCFYVYGRQDTPVVGTKYPLPAFKQA